MCQFDRGDLLLSLKSGNHKKGWKEGRFVDPYGAFVYILGFVANNNLETAQIRAFWAATEKDVLQRVALARAGLDTFRVDTLEFARRNYETAQGKTIEVAGQAQQLWQENSQKVVQVVKAAYEKATTR